MISYHTLQTNLIYTRAYFFLKLNSCKSELPGIVFVTISVFVPDFDKKLYQDVLDQEEQKNSLG